ncbi:MAG: hypothetical protein ABW042_09085 [Phenylobacterium sp.]
MAKRKKKAVPKRLAGVKIPKTMRQGLNDLLASKRGRALVAEAVMAAGAAIAAKKGHVGRKTQNLLEEMQPGETAKDKAGAAASVSSALAFALGEAGRSFADALQRGKAMADAKAAWPETGDDTAKKKKTPGPEASPAH